MSHKSTRPIRLAVATTSASAASVYTTACSTVSVAGGATVSFARSHFSIHLKNSNRASNAASCGFCIGRSAYVDGSVSMGASQQMVPRARLIYAESFPACSLARTPSLMSGESMWSYTPSKLPNFCTKSVAVFSPTPGTPGMWSLVSPISALRSMSCAGVSPYFSCTAAGVYSTVSGLPILVAASNTCTWSLTSCNASRSPVAMTHSSPDFTQAEASVPSRSSASNPSCSITEQPISCNISFKIGIWLRSSSGIPLRPALYSSYILWRKVGACTSNATAIPSGSDRSRSFCKMLKKPNNALVNSPFFVDNRRTP